MNKENTEILHKFAPMNQELHIEAYNPERKLLWDNFVAASRNATFLLKRDYMDYHADRFKDCSLMISRQDKLIAVFAASAHECEVRAHGGLTYGGLIFGDDFSATIAVTVFEAIAAYYKAQGYTSLLYKAIPHIYHRYPAEEDIYALFRCEAQLVECNVSSTIDLKCPIRFNNTRRWQARKCAKDGVLVRKEADFTEYWKILSSLLQERYNTLPVHSLTEMIYLRDKFADNIKLYCAYDSAGQILGGVLVYDCGICIHCQYVATTNAGREQGVLSLIYDYIIANECSNARYFDFGSSNEDHGRFLNEGLLAQKYSLGGRAVAYNIYRIAL